VVLAFLGVVGAVGIGWYYSGEILVVAEEEPPVYDTAVLDVEDDRVVLADSEAARKPGTWGLDFPDGYAQVGDVLAAGDDLAGVTRQLIVLDGVVEADLDVRVDGYAFPPEPDRAGFGFAVSEVQVPAPLGNQPAWFAPADDDRWAVLVHGRGAGRHECFRLLPVLHELDWSSLCTTYRNDPGGPDDPQGLYRQGATEWEDAEAAVRYARDQGADSIVLVGFSMGGQITANLLRHSDLAPEVDAVIWDAPLLDWGPAIAAGARERGVPELLVPLGMTASELRAGIDYDDLDQIEHADEFEHPILLFHGTADGTVPVSVSDRFAAARPDLVTYERVNGADHVASWNVDRARYEDAIRRFLTPTAGPVAP
jgi:hypothetical protein